MATYIAHGDVALSVLMTTASTLGAIVMTPLLTKMLAGTLVPVDAKVLIPTISRLSMHLTVSLWTKPSNMTGTWLAVAGTVQG